MTATYDCIATTTLGSAQGSITFSSISGSFTDLVLVITPKQSTMSNYGVQFNSDTGTNYSNTYIAGNGSAASSSRFSSAAQIRVSAQLYGTAANNDGIMIMNFMNYSNTTTNKTMLSRTSLGGGSGDTGAGADVGLWRSTSAITSIYIFPLSGGNFNSGTTATLYGIKAA